MISLNYQKRKNSELFVDLAKPSTLHLSEIQNYIPIYSQFFDLNETNYNNINLNNDWFLSNVVKKVPEVENTCVCKIKTNAAKTQKQKQVFFKMAPLLDPYKYLIGKYDINDRNLFNLPKLKVGHECNAKMLNVNNSAYVDGLFLFLSGQLKAEANFIHGIEYYGSCLALKHNFKVDVYEDIDYFNNSEFFNTHKNSLFTIDDYSHLFQQDQCKQVPIKIGGNLSAKSNLSIKSFDNDVFEDIFEETTTVPSINLNDLKDMSMELVDVINSPLVVDPNVTLRSTSTCSSRSSYTEDDDNEDCPNCNEDTNKEVDVNKEEDEEEEEEEEEEDEEEDEDEDEDEDDDEEIFATIPAFPVQVMAMESCESTFDELIITTDLTTEEWYSALMQIIMTLIAYQKVFHFTHNDLHTNNVMYIHTKEKYIYYCHNNVKYRVPTFGRIFKIIDFGRSIYKFNGKLFCSDSFQTGGDAATQYNTEPFFNDKKPRLEPNYSFDLCRLACSMFDYMVEDFDELPNIDTIEDPVKRLIFEWCLDDKGNNMLYKNNGIERYPSFKLYKMIARCVHNHTPQAQLERPEFKAYIFNELKKGQDSCYVNIDKMQCCA